MPFSSSVFDDTVTSLLRTLSPESCLDVGAGAGKYGELIRAELPGCFTRGIEVDAEYVDKYRLAKIYNRIDCCDVMSLLETDLDTTFDLVIAGDIIEHLRKSAGLDLLHFLTYRSRFIVLVYPLRFLQGTVEGKRSEAHISSWVAADFTWSESASVRAAGQELAVLRGYRHSSIGLDDLRPILQAHDAGMIEPVTAFDEAAYLAANPDVAKAVEAGLFSNGREHFDAFGRREKRPLQL